MNDKKLTPVMQQYVDLKSENPDALLLFRLGDFYEVFFEDAKTVSSVLGLVLTSRGNDDIPMCGIPWHAADSYFGRLVRAGYKVALVEQMETPAAAKAAGRKQIKRAVVRVMTPGTLTDDNLLNPKNSNFLVAVLPGDGIFDIAGCDISTGEFFIGTSASITDDMARVNPAEIIYPAGAAETEDILRLRDTYRTTPVYEKLYIREDIGQIVHKVFGTSITNHESRITSNENDAVVLLAGYLFNTQRDANIAFRAPYTFGAGAQLLVDGATWKSLEIDAPMNDGGLCLVDILDKTHTAHGARRLRSYLRTLSGDIGEIRRRQEHIGHLILNPDVMGGLTRVLSRVPDIGRSLSRLLSGRGTPRDMRHTADFLMLLSDIRSAGLRMDINLADRFDKINTHDMLAAELKSALSDELPTFFRDGGVIRTGFDPGLDNMRNLAHGARNAVAELQAQYVADTAINTLKIKYNNILGYFIEVPSTRADNMMRPDSGFIHRQTMAGNMRFTTSQLIDLDNEVRSAADRASGIEAEIVTTLIEKIRNVSDDLLNTAELTADADVWASLASVASEYEWVRADVTDGVEFDVRGGRHPVIEYVLRKSGDRFVKNNCDLGERRIALMTGPNMAGKSTYLRQNAIIVVCAHLGSFVPADFARIGVCDQLFSRVGASDNLAAGQSTFMVEMNETANILNRATDKSFIIFDEIGRGTATYDGMAIANAVLEFLDGVAPRTLFATHYHELTALEMNNVGHLTIEVREHNNEIIFMHKIVPGVANRSYGIHVAKMAGMPRSVIERATQILEALECRGVGAMTYNGQISEPGVKPRVEEPKTKSQLSLFS